MNYNELPTTDRPLNRFMEYPQWVSNAELISILSGINDIEKCNLIARDIKTLPNRLENFKEYGLTKLQAGRILAGMELSRRVFASTKENIIIHGPDDAADLLYSSYSLRDKETFGLLILNIKNQVIHISEISIGSLTASVVHPREVFKEALKQSAASLILFHNHPSGDPTPSREDISITDRLVKCGKLFDVPVLDHIIIGYNKYKSLQEEGLIKQ